MEAQQCVPFEQRVLIFRSLVAADKERCARAHACIVTRMPLSIAVTLQGTPS
jgi:hypothetical protein